MTFQTDTAVSAPLVAGLDCLLIFGHYQELSKRDETCEVVKQPRVWSASRQPVERHQIIQRRDLIDCLVKIAVLGTVLKKKKKTEK